MRLSPEIPEKEYAVLQERKRFIMENDPQAVEAAEKARKEEAIKRADKRLKGAEMGAGETTEDVVRSTVRGGGRGVVGSPGTFADTYRLGQLARSYVDSWAQGRPQEGVLKEADERRTREGGGSVLGIPMPSPETVERYGSEAFIKSATPALPGLEYEPKTRPGEMGSIISETAGGAVGGRAPLAAAQAVTRIAPRYIARGVAREAATGAGAGVASGGAQQVTDNPIVALSAGALGGVAAGSRGSHSADRAVRQATGNATAQQVQDAEELFMRAQVAGIPVTRAQTLAAVMGGESDAPELQRLVESAGSPTLKQHFAGAPEAIRREGGRVLDTIGPQSGQPATIGPRVQEQGDAAVRAAEQNVNTQTRPAYQAIEGNPLDPAALDRLRQDRAFVAAEQRVMGDDDLADLVARHPPGSVGYVDIIRAEMENRGANRQTPGGDPSASMNPRAAEGLRGPTQRAQDAASDASGPPDPVTGLTPLQAVQQRQAALRDREVRPIQAGPEGQAARQGDQATTAGVSGAYFPKDPREGSHQEVQRAISDLAARDPNLAREFVRNYLGTEFARGTAANIPGDPYTGGAKFWKNIGGNPQQRENLLTAIRALPNGDHLAEGFTRFTQILEATGQRQNPGSKTAYNTPKLQELGEGGVIEQGAKIAGSGGLRFLGRANEKLQQWRLGHNTEEIASLLTDPARANDWRVLATLPADSPIAARLVERIIFSRPNAATAAEIGAPVLEDPGNQLPSFTVRPRGNR